MKKIEALRREIIDANVFALLAATDSQRLAMSQAVWATGNGSPATAVWATPATNIRREAVETRQ